MENKTTLDSLKTEVFAIKKHLGSLKADLVIEKNTSEQLRIDLDRQIQTNLNNIRKIATLFEELHKTGKITDYLIV